MPELTREEKLKLVEKLPQQLQDLLYSEDTGAVLLYLGQKYNLPDEKVRLLSKLVGDVVLKIVPITSLAQEINSKITSNAQAAMNLAQELYAELLAPVITTSNAPPTPVASIPIPATPAPAPAAVPPQPVAPPSPPVDRYREPTVGPEVVDLRNQPKAGPPRVEIPPPTPFLPPKPITVPPTPVPIPTPKPVIPTPPLTFTRPVEPAAPLIEAEPHKIPIPAEKPIVSAPKPVDTYREPTETQSPRPVSTPIPTSPTPEPRPQYIMRPSGAPPTDLPDNVLDLRKDKGEF